MNFPEFKHLATAIDHLAAALEKKDDAFPETNPGPIPVEQPTASVSQPAAQPKPQAQTVPTTATKTYQFNDLARAAAGLMDAGKQQQLVGLLQQFGVQALTQLPKDKYGAFATALRQLGAAI